MLPLAGIFMIVIIGFTAVGVEAGLLYVKHNELQVVADSAALAAVSRLDDRGVARGVAIRLARENMPADDDDPVLRPRDIEFGTWSREREAFTPGAAFPNAVRVVARRTEDNGNAVPLAFARVIGHEFADVSAEAVAFRDTDCFGRGLIAGGTVRLDEDARLDDYCIYGREGIDIDDDAQLDGRSRLGALDKDRIRIGDDARCGSGPIESCLFEGSKQATLANKVADLIDDLEAAIFPPRINNVNVSRELPFSLSEGTAYVVNGNVTIDTNRRVQNVIIAARGDVRLAEHASVINTGREDSGDVTVGLYATGDMSLGDHSKAEGVRMVVGDDLTIGDHVNKLDASIQVKDDVTFDDDARFKSEWPGFSETASGRLVY